MDGENLWKEESSEASDRQGVNVEIGHNVYRGQVGTYSIILNMERARGILDEVAANDVDKHR